MLILQELSMLKRIAVVLGLLAAVAAAPLGAEIIEQVLVNVNGDILSKTEFEQRQVAILRQRPELANVTPDSPVLRKAVLEVTPQLILEAVDELLLIQRGRELGLTLGDEQFASIVENIRKSNNIESDEQFQMALKQEGMTMPDLRRALERQMLASEAQRRDVVDKISVTEAEARAYYEAHKGEFTTPSEVTLREILIEVPLTDKGINVAQDDEAKAEAEDVRKRLLAGEPFPRLAAEFSDAPSKANGGLIGPIRENELAEALQQQLSKLKVGDLTQPIRTARGYQLLKLESRTDTRIRAFDDARGDISNKVGGDKMAAERLKYLEKLRGQATITWRNEELRKAYEQALAERRKGLAG
jgi:peptidyl-prolyl cis-trans isomerase SurA